MRPVLLVVLGMTATAVASPEPPDRAGENVLAAHTLHSGMPAGRFGFGTEGEVMIDPEAQEVGGSPYPIAMVRPVIARGAADAKVAWYAADVHATPGCEVEKPCTKKPTLFFAGTVLLVQGTDGAWRPIAWHLAKPVTGKEQASALAAGETLDEVPARIDPGAEPIAKRFRDTIGDPKAFAASISPRAETLMFGSSPGERWLGGSRVAAQLAAWKLALRVHDGVQAGLAPGGTVGWIAANVDAVPVGSTKKPTPYRVTAFYELAKGTWRVVALQFSFAANPYAI